MPTRNTRRLTRAFSLVELLVVMAVVAVMISMLLPGLSRAKEVSRRAACLGALQQWGRAFTGYAADNKGEYVTMGAAEDSASPQWYIPHVTTERRNRIAPYFGIPVIAKPSSTAPAAVLAALPLLGHANPRNGFPMCPNSIDVNAAGQVFWSSSWGWVGAIAIQINAPTSITNVAPVWVAPKNLNGIANLRMASCNVAQYPTNITGYKPGSIGLHGPNGRVTGPNGAAPATFACQGTNSVYVDGSARWTPVNDMQGYNTDSFWSHYTPASFFRSWW